MEASSKPKDAMPRTDQPLTQVDDTDDVNMSEENLRLMEEQFAREKDRMEQIRGQYYERQKHALKRQQDNHEKRMKDLEEQIERFRKERLDMREILAAKKIHTQNQSQIQLQFQHEVWSLEREHQLEETARRRIKMEALREERLAMERMLDQRLIHLEEIEQEKQRRGRSEAEKLQQLLDRGDHLQKQLTLEQVDADDIKDQIEKSMKIHGAERHLLDEEHPENSMIRLVDEIEALRKRKREKVTLQTNQRLKELNKERHLLLEQEDKLRAQKREYNLLNQKGIDFMVEMEYGTAPPKEFILKNIVSQKDELRKDQDFNGDEEEDEDVFQDVNKVIEKAQEIVSTGISRIDALKKDLELQSSSEIKPYVYDGSLGPDSYKPSQRNIYQFCFGLVTKLVETIYQGIEKAPTIAEVLGTEKMWIETKASLERINEQEALTKAMHIELQAIYDIVINEMIKDIWQEVDFMKQTVTALMDASILNCVMGFRFGAKEIVLESFREMKARRKKYDKSTNYEKLHIMSQRLVMPQPEEESEEVSTKKNKKIKQIQPSMEEPLTKEEIGAPHADAKIFKLRKDIHVESIQQNFPKLTALEKNYWKDVKIEPQNLMLASNVSKCCLISVSENGQYMAGGTSTGFLYVWYLGTKPPLLLRRVATIPKADRAALTHLQWSLNQCDVITINSKHLVQVWTVLPLKGIELSHSTSFFQHHPSDQMTSFSFAPPTLYPRLTIQPSQFKRPGLPRNLDDLDGLGMKKRKNSIPASASASKEKKIDEPTTKENVDDRLLSTFATFAPSLSLIGQQDSIVMGTLGGIIMKWNASASKTKEDKVVYGNCMATSESPYHYNDEAVTSSPSSASTSAVPFRVATKTIQREFFHAHRSKIIYLGYRNFVEPNMVSVDEEGILCVWPYQPDFFTGYAWFVPSMKIRLDARFPIPSADGIEKDPEDDGESFAQFQEKQRQAKKDDGIHYAHITQVVPSASKRELVVMFFYEPCKPTDPSMLRIVLFNLVTLSLEPTLITVPVRGSTPAHMAITRFLDGCGSDFVVLLMNNSISIYSLVTSQLVHPILHLIGANQPSYPFTSVSVGGTNSLFICAVGEQHNMISILELKDMNTDESMLKYKRVSKAPRFYETPSEVMIGRRQFDARGKELILLIASILYDVADQIVDPSTLRKGEDAILPLIEEAANEEASLVEEEKQGL